MKEYRTELKPVWCKACGNYGILDSLTRRVFSKLQIPKHQIFIVSGIGCSSRIAGYIDTYGINSLHGRVLTIAQGAKLDRPELTVIAIGGDGDLFSIGAGHLPHAVRRNIDITCVMVNNFVYALTKGQTSPTTPHLEAGEKVSISQTYNPPVDPILDMIAFSFSTKASFIAQGIAVDPKHLCQLLEQGILHKGFSFISVLTPCVTFNNPKLFQRIKEVAVYLEDGIVDLPKLPEGKVLLHDPSNFTLAQELATQASLVEKPHLGVFFKGKERTA